MIALGMDIVRAAREKQTAIGAFTTYTLESTRAICEAADAAEQPLILQAGASSFRSVGRTLLASAALAAARAANQPIGVHLDHSTDLAEIRACLELGYTSVMIDGSHEDFETNVSLTGQVVKEAHAVGAWVEGELGTFAGNEDVSVATLSAEYTDPSKVAEFVERTGVDVLAVAIGSVHGMSTVPMHLDLELLARITEQTEVPLALHGASGIDQSELWAAVRLGMSKVNYNTELRQSYLDSLRRSLAECGDDLVALQRSAIDRVSKTAQEKVVFLMRGFGG